MSLLSNWVSSPYHFVLQTQVSDTLTPTQLRNSGSKHGLGLLKALFALVIPKPRHLTNPSLDVHLRNATTRLQANKDISDSLQIIKEKELCRSNHIVAVPLLSPELRAFFSSLAHVCAPAASKDDDSNSSEGNNSNSSAGEEDLHSSEPGEDEEMIDHEMEGVSDDGQVGDDSMDYSSDTHSAEDSQHSKYNPPSLSELDDDEGGESKKLEIEVQVMCYELAQAVLTTVRMNDSADDMEPALEYSISRNTDILELKVPPIKSTVEDDGGADFHFYNTQRQWVTNADVPRPLIFEFKSTPRNVAPQHLAEVLKVLQQRFQWLKVKTVADLQRLDERFLQVCLLSGQGKYLGVMIAHIPKVWCRRHIFGDQSAPVMDMTDQAEYIRLEYDPAFDLSKAAGRLGAAVLLIAAIEYAKQLVDFGLWTIAHSPVPAPAVIV